jgi:putative iron-regulated protein
LLFFVACGDDGESSTNAGTSTGLNTATATAALGTYAEIVYATYNDSLTAAQTMNAAIVAFVDAPTEAGLTAAKEAWLAAREPYLQTEVYRFYEGPIDNADGPEGLLNAWPMDEAYVDYVVDSETAGIINDTSIEITAESLENANEFGKDDNIATGYHAIEFLLWGQDLSDTGAGARPYTDFLVDGGTAANQDRRGLYLKTASTLLIGHLEGLKNAWAPNASGNYRSEFVALDAAEGVRRIMTGMIILAGFETGGERVQAALTSGDKEDEHSCFSDNTHRDMIQDVQGIVNVFNGAYGSVSGTGIKAVIEATDPALAADIETKLGEALAVANALPIPFDQAIALSNTEGRAVVENLVVKLRSTESAMESAFTLFGLTIPEAE